MAWTRFCWSWWQNTYWLNWDHDKGNPPFNKTGQKISGCFFTCHIRVVFLQAEISQQFTKRKSSPDLVCFTCTGKEGQGQARHVKINIPVAQSRRWHRWWACGPGQPAHRLCCRAAPCLSICSIVPMCSTMSSCVAPHPCCQDPGGVLGFECRGSKRENRCCWSDVNSAHSHGNSLTVASYLSTWWQGNPNGGSSSPIEIFLWGWRGRWAWHCFEQCWMFRCSYVWRNQAFQGKCLFLESPSLCWLTPFREEAWVKHPKPRVPHRSHQLHG